VTGSACQLQVLEAVWFVSGPDDPPERRRQQLAATLERLGVRSESQRTVALLEDPLAGRQYQVRVTPCLVLDTGTRRVQLLGDAAALDAAALESALARA
jgi:hypothetical protein